MSKHKIEVLTVKIQLKVKFPQAVITKIRTLPPVFPKMFRTVVRRKTRDGCCKKLGMAASDIRYVRKALIFVVRK